MSLENKVHLFSIGIFAAITGTACTEDPKKIGGVAISEAVTDNDGRAYFTEEKSGEEVEVHLTIDKTDFPISDATVLYFDGADFKAFLLNHRAFAPQLQIAEHNSNHYYSLTPAPLQALHNSFSKERSKPAAEGYLSWAEANWEHTGCLNRKNMVTLMKPGAYLMKKLGLLETIGFSDEKFDQRVQYVEDNLPESASADVYVFIPYQHGFSASTTTITALDIKFKGGCIDETGNNSSSGSSDNGSDDDNNNNNNYDVCPGTLFCDYFNGSALNTSRWNIVNDSGIEVQGGWLSLPNASSIAVQDQLGNSCQDKEVNLRSASYVGSVFLGDMGLSANKDKGILSCDGEDAIVDITGAENGLSLYKSGGLLSLLIDDKVTSIPCSKDISYVQLTAGLNDLVEIDYVKVRCKQ
ncbi:MAG: hypothetical protein AABY40_02370 [Nanoarchaeota archaeon]